MVDDKLATYIIGLIIIVVFTIFTYQGIIDQHVYYVSSKVNIRFDGYQAIFFGIASFLVVIYMIHILLIRKKK